MTLSFLLILLNIFSFIPQIKQILKDRSAKIYDYYYYIQIIFILSLWLMYGINNNIDLIVIQQTVVLFGFFIILYYMFKYEKINLLKYIISIVFVFILSYFLSFYNILFNFLIIFLSVGSQIMFLRNVINNNLFKELSSFWLIHLLIIMSILTYKAFEINDNIMFYVNLFNVCVFLYLLLKNYSLSKFSSQEIL